MKWACPTCGASTSRSRTGCAKCYMRGYRKTPEGKRNADKADKKWKAANPDKVFEYVVRYRERIGYYTPIDLIGLWRANKRLEKALVEAAQRAGLRGTGKRCSDDDFE